MAQSRKDSRGYALRSGECQRADGRYSYSYTDRNRKRHTVYGKDLVERSAFTELFVMINSIIINAAGFWPAAFSVCFIFSFLP